jgi:hypothetical protein
MLQEQDECLQEMSKFSKLIDIFYEEINDRNNIVQEYSKQSCFALFTYE